jgi:hypothetical protein
MGTDRITMAVTVGTTRPTKRIRRTTTRRIKRTTTRTSRSIPAAARARKLSASSENSRGAVAAFDPKSPIVGGEP